MQETFLAAIQDDSLHASVPLFSHLTLPYRSPPLLPSWNSTTPCGITLIIAGNTALAYALSRPPFPK